MITHKFDFGNLLCGLQIRRKHYSAVRRQQSNATLYFDYIYLLYFEGHTGC